MLTARQNLIETIRGGNPDRFVKQYEFMELIVFMPGFKYPLTPGVTVKDGWGITFDFPEGQIGGFPVHDDEHKVLKDITQWDKIVKPPVLDTSDAAWAEAFELANSVNREEQFVAACQMPGIFEMTHLSIRFEIPKAAIVSIGDMLDNCAKIQPGQEVLLLAHIDGLHGSDNMVDEQAISWIQSSVKLRGANASILWIDEPVTPHAWRFPQVV